LPPHPSRTLARVDQKSWQTRICDPSRRRTNQKKEKALVAMCVTIRPESHRCAHTSSRRAARIKEPVLADTSARRAVTTTSVWPRRRRSRLPARPAPVAPPSAGRTACAQQVEQSCGAPCGALDSGLCGLPGACHGFLRRVRSLRDRSSASSIRRTYARMPPWRVSASAAWRYGGG